MESLKLKARPAVENQPKLRHRFDKLEALLAALRTRELPEAPKAAIEARIRELNAIHDQDTKLPRHVRKTYKVILQILEKQLKWVPRNYYRTLWTGMGMAAIGIPIGTALGVSLGNMAFLAIGIPIGMAIGLAIGTSMDARAAREGRQLEVEAG